MRTYKSFAAILLTLAGTAWGATVTNQISINTTSLPAPTSGYLDIVFNGGGTPFQPATYSITGFATNATLSATNVSKSAGVTGQLPGTVSASNANTEYLQAITFGSSISFTLQFSGPALDSPTGTGSGTSFAFSLLNSTLDGAYLTSDQNDGYLFVINIDNQGRTTSITYPTESGGPSVTSIQTVPEPAGWLTAGIGLMLVGRFFGKFRRTS